MAYRDSYGSSLRGSVTPWVLRLLIANTAVFAAMLLGGLVGAGGWAQWLALEPLRVLYRPWTILTYAFVHAGIGHWFFNMVGLFFFGPRLEEQWGGREFIKYYLVAAAGGAIFSFIAPHGSVVGASAAIYGLLLAWAIYWPTEQVFFMGLLPIQIRWLVIGYVFLSLFGAMGAGGGGVAYLAHLGGFATAFLYLKSPWAPPSWGELPVRRKAKKPAARAVVPWSAGKKEANAAAQPPRPIATAGPRRSPGAEKELLDDVDRILDKISAEGLSSLTPDERARLDEVSRRYRTN